MEEAVQNTAANAVEVSSKLRLSKIDLSTVNLKTAGKLGGVVLVAGAALGGYIWVRREMKAGGAAPTEAPVDDLSDGTVAEPACLTSFRASLMAYVEAGSKGRLTTQIVYKLANDLGDVEQLPPQDAVAFTLDEMLPLLELVIAHTPILAQAFDVELDEEILESEGVHSLQRHLGAQMAILAKAA